MIHVIGNPTEQSAKYQAGDWNQFKPWILELAEVEFDVETTVSPWWSEKKLITVQFGWNGTEWVFQWSELSVEQKDWIKQILESKRILKLIHNALFECTVCLFHDIRVQNVYDTMLAEMVLQGGEHTVGYGLDDICLKRLNIVLDKSQQLLFGDNILNEAKVIYAAQDVKYLSNIRLSIQQEAQAKNYETLNKVIELENSIVPAFAEMVFHGMELDKEWWLGLAREAEPLVSAAQQKLNEWLQQEPFRTVAYQLNYLSDKDRVLINWNSPKQKEKLFQDLFPELPGTSKAVLKKWQSTQLKAQQPVPEWLPYYLDGDSTEVSKVVVNEHRDYLIAEQQLIPAGTPTINWNSTYQVLPLIQCVERVNDLSAESLGRTSHPIVADYEEYKDTAKLLSSFGEKWIEKYVEPDGKVRTSFRQILATGRTSSSGPNLQQLPKNKRVGNKYRNAFILPPKWKWVSTDFVSEELVIVAYLSQETVWLEALSKGCDLHSSVAEVVFKKKWKDAATSTCEFYHPHVDDKGVLWPAYSRKKCNCNAHKYLRDATKTVNFMLVYGGSHFKLASTLRITVPEAQQIIEDYFKALPKLKKVLDYLGEFGITKGYIQTIWPYYRRRWFPNWQFYTRFIDAHLQSAQFHGGLGEIERASKNTPVQGSGGDILKLSIRNVYNYIHDNDLSSKVHLKMEVHDSLDTAAKEEYAEEWSIIQSRLMEDAGRVLIPTGILKTDTTLTVRWS
jgi:DNA polymerase I-like protein with 3'-5' exonuclease and polymerase domains